MINFKKMFFRISAATLVIALLAGLFFTGELAVYADSDGNEISAASGDGGVISAVSGDGGVISAVSGDGGVISATSGDGGDSSPEAVIHKVQGPPAREEFRAVWIAYYDFEDTMGADEETFRAAMAEKFENAVLMNLNAVVVHVRPFSDAMYKSKYYPWSKYASGKQGVDPGYDPLAIMIEEAHKRNLEIHAWLNPYRVTSSGTKVKVLSKRNPARKWRTNSKTSDDRNVLSYGGKLYYNPSKEAVQKLIVNGVREIVENYDVDGIHFDDYFYPSLGETAYATNFDAPEYEEYVAARIKKGKSFKSIEDWRKAKVNELVRAVYAAVKEADPNCVFGISPGGYIDYFDDVHRWYVDYRTWMSKPGYVDYICPQLYWSFNSLNTYPFYETLLKWASALKTDSVKLYIGIPVYKMNSKVAIGSTNSTTDTEWYNQHLLADMIRYSRESDFTSGFIFFDYADTVVSKNRTAIELLKNELAQDEW